MVTSETIQKHMATNKNEMKWIKSVKLFTVIIQIIHLWRLKKLF